MYHHTPTPENSDFSKDKQEKFHQRLLIFTLVIINLIYFLSSAYITCSNDGSQFALVSAIVENKSTDITEYVGWTDLVDYNYKDGRYYSDRPPGTAFIAAPFFTIGKFVQEGGLFSYLNLQKDPRQVFVILLPNIAGTIVVLLLFRLYNFFGLDFKSSLISAVLFAFTTLVWLESTRLFSHIVSMALVMSAIYLLITKKQYSLRRTIAISSLLAFSAITEIQNILFIFPFVIYLILSKRISLKHLPSKEGLFLALTAVIAFGLVYSTLLAYNYITFKELTIKSNQYNPHYTMENDFSSSLSGNVVAGIDKLLMNLKTPEVIFDTSKGKFNSTPGIFIVSPILLLSILGFIQFWREHKNEAILFILMISTEILIVSLHFNVLTRHISTIYPLVFFPLVFVVKKSFIDQKKDPNSSGYYLFSSILILSLVSISRVFYYMNSNRGRSIDDPFKFIKEIRSYILFFGVVLSIYVSYKFIVWVYHILDEKKKIH